MLALYKQLLSENVIIGKRLYKTILILLILQMILVLIDVIQTISNDLISISLVMSLIISSALLILLISEYCKK